MTTITIKINERTKAGKAFLAMTESFLKNQKGIEVIHERPRYNKTTQRAIDDARNGKEITQTKSHADLMKKLSA